MGNRKKTSTKKSDVSSKIKVLYQNLNGVWYAFAASGEQLFFGRVPVQSKAPQTPKAKNKKKNLDSAA